MRGHIGADLSVQLLYRPSKQLDLPVARLSVGHVGQRDAGDPLGGYLPGVHMTAEGDGGENTDLPAGVVSFHVGGGVLFCITVLLGLFQRGLKGEARAYHAGEDIICRAVQDSADLCELVGGQALREGTQNRDAAAHARLKQIAHAHLRRQLDELVPALGHQLLIGGNHALPGPQRPARIVQGHCGPTDGLHNDIYRLVVFNGRKIMDDLVLKGALRKVAHIQNIFQADGRLHLLVDMFPIFGQHLGHTGPHRAKAQNCNIYHTIKLSSRTELPTRPESHI